MTCGQRLTASRVAGRYGEYYCNSMHQAQVNLYTLGLLRKRWKRLQKVNDEPKKGE